MQSLVLRLQTYSFAPENTQIGPHRRHVVVRQPYNIVTADKRYSWCTYISWSVKINLTINFLQQHFANIDDIRNFCTELSVSELRIRTTKSLSSSCTLSCRTTFFHVYTELFAVTLRYCIKTAKHIRKLFRPSESAIILVF